MMSAEQTRIETLTGNRIWSLRALSSVWLIAFSVAAFWMTLIAAIHRNSPRTLVSFHGLLHAAISGQFLGAGSGSFLPENPFYAGEPLPYYWFYQYLAAQITRLSGLNIFYSFEILALIATAGLMFTAVFLGRKLYDSAITGILMGYLIVAGANPFGWIQLLRSVSRGGWNVLNDRPSHLWGVVHPLYSLVRYNDIGGLYGPLINFFLNVTSRPVALALLLVTIFCLRWALRNPNPQGLIALGIASALTTALSPIIGIAAGAALATALLGSLTLSWFVHRKAAQTETTISTKATLFAILAIIAGMLIAGPTYYHLVFGPKASGLRFWLFSIGGLRQVISVALSIFLLVILAFVGTVKSRQEQRPFLGILILAAFVLLGLNVAFLLPAGNASNLFHAAVVLLAVPAAGSILSRKRSAISLRSVVIFLVFLPTTLLVLASYINRPALSAGFQSEKIARLPANDDLSRLYQWIQNETDPKAIFIIDPRERVTLCGNAAELPAMTGRAIFTEDQDHYMVEPFPDSKLRFDMAVRLVTGTQISDTDRTYLAKFNRPIYVVSDNSMDQAATSRMQEIYGMPAFGAGTIAVYQWR